MYNDNSSCCYYYLFLVLTNLALFFKACNRIVQKKKPMLDKKWKKIGKIYTIICLFINIIFSLIFIDIVREGWQDGGNGYFASFFVPVILLSGAEYYLFGWIFSLTCTFKKYKSYDEGEISRSQILGASMFFSHLVVFILISLELI